MAAFIQLQRWWAWALRIARMQLRWPSYHPPRYFVLAWDADAPEPHRGLAQQLAKLAPVHHIGPPRKEEYAGCCGKHPSRNLTWMSRDDILVLDGREVEHLPAPLASAVSAKMLVIVCLVDIRTPRPAGLLMHPNVRFVHGDTAPELRERILGELAHERRIRVPDQDPVSIGRP